jgi:D-lactate dehydrogenase
VKEKGLCFGYLGDYCSYAVAEHAVLMAMILLRKLKTQEKQFLNFCRENITGQQIRQRKILVIGVGQIGKNIAELAKNLKAEVKGVDIEQRESDVEYVSLKEGLSWAEIVFCALPLTEKTNKLLNYDLLKSVGKIFLINVSRGEITPEKDLQRLINEKKVIGLGLDVFENEKEMASCFRSKRNTKSAKENIIENLFKQDNVIFTPHNAFNTEESLEEKAKQSVEALVQYLDNKTFLHSL